VLLVVPLLFISAGWLAGGLFGLSLGWAGVATGLTLAAFTLVPGRAASLACLILLGELVAYHSLAPVAAIAPAHSRKPSQLEALVPALTRASVARGDAEVAQFAAGKFEDDTGTRTFDPAGRRYVIEARGDWAGNNAEEDGVSIAEGYGDPAPWRVSALLAKRTAAIDRLLGISLYVRRVGPPRDDLTHIASPRDTVALFGGSRPMPRAFLVDDGPRVQVLSDQAALARVADQAFDPEADLVVDHQVPLAGATARAEASLATVGSHQPERVEIDAVAARPATLVLTDAAFPGWAVEVDGAPAEGQIADFAFRAVHLQPGPHHIVWRYRPSSLRLGLWSSALAALVLAGLCWRKSGFVSSGR
jgi:hypothetical protein